MNQRLLSHDNDSSKAATALATSDIVMKVVLNAFTTHLQESSSSSTSGGNGVVVVNDVGSRRGSKSDYSKVKSGR